jgi:transposase-like protein
MNEATANAAALPLPTDKDVLTEVLRQGATRLLAQAIQAEVAAYLDARSDVRDETGRQQVVRNGYLPRRTILTGVGPVDVKQPRVQDRRPPEQREKFSSAILPPYLRKTKSIEELIPWLYLKGVSTGDFSEALAALLGPQAKGLSAATVTRLKAAWAEEYKAWSKRSLAGRHYVYVWADGVHFNIRLEDDRQCILVLMGAANNGRKDLIALADGYRESEQSWTALLLDCRARGLTAAPLLATGDGALGFWKVLRKLFPATWEQRCWVHKTANVLDKMAKGQQSKAKAMLHDIWQAATRTEA